MNQEVIYEVRLEIDSKIEQEFDDWLGEHIAEMLAFEGFLSAEVRVPSDTPIPVTQSTVEPDSSPPEPEKVVRLVQYHVNSHESLESYINEHAPRMRDQGVQRFDDRFSATRATYDLGVNPAHSCLNCNTPLRSQYCEQCGQRSRRRGISLWELLSDLVGDLFEFDSRVWRTLRPLLFNPGQLTAEYLRGRRVHYTPPLRLYLITSLIFFLVAFFNTDPDTQFTVDGKTSDLATTIAAIEASANEADADSQAPELARPSEDSAPESSAEQTPDEEVTPPDLNSLREKCEKNIDFGEGKWADFIGPRALQACYNLTADGGTGRFMRNLADNTPAMMFIFLPVVALVMLFLYPFSKRYYVEHLLFFVHFHSFFFLLLTLMMLFSRLPLVFAGQELVGALLGIAVVIYIPYYLFGAMRRVYGQSFRLTALKYVALGAAYFISLLFSFTATAFVTALLA